MRVHFMLYPKKKIAHHVIAKVFGDNVSAEITDEAIKRINWDSYNWKSRTLARMRVSLT